MRVTLCCHSLFFYTKRIGVKIMKPKDLKAKPQEKQDQNVERVQPSDTEKYQRDFINALLENNPKKIYDTTINKLAALSSRLCHIKRELRRDDNISCDIDSITEEIVDVQICLDGLRLFYNINTEIFEHIKNIKLEEIRKNST